MTEIYCFKIVWPKVTTDKNKNLEAPKTLLSLTESSNSALRIIIRRRPQFFISNFLNFFRFKYQGVHCGENWQAMIKVETNFLPEKQNKKQIERNIFYESKL